MLVMVLGRYPPWVPGEEGMEVERDQFAGPEDAVKGSTSKEDPAERDA